MPSVKPAHSLFGLVVFVASVSAAAEPGSFAPRLFAFQNGVAFGSLDQEAATLKALGYDGIGSVGLGQLEERIAAYEAVGLKVFSIYVNLGDPQIVKAIPHLKDREATIELTVRKKIDDATVKELQDLADLAAEANVRIALYPHAGFTIATIDPALELIEKADRPNVGVMFNLCHFLKGEKEQDLEATLTRANAKIFAVSTCGADKDGNNWGTLIQPLDKGTFEQARLFRTLAELGFQGAVGIQCYAVRGDKRENLQRSVDAWKKILAEVNAKE
jgi:sugar phosphate isomerase/epimerase